ncbi:bifunctional methylenetetrahydrofolate dehydrogenase/methenyltetrahydrofolate cyclohydrolase FolD [Halomonas sp. MCCC 1A17488]|uniref:bifunctional methylenetetrahydrofolate dehydrogenase/methenyltetrahydrofolate cyclohydrolase FolD n=1 Tax=unclassified Halomonas TaxID=2609666 RepID=UPI0018D26BED|nr:MULTISPECIES: bifunctional methylenetetrahydrofolate dehydrogenase/methenyltetrahydrofolate cyclohydrolase FolD [unclassified Halomonas]MCE8017728.1 bifunctional methylenetetrahydrofolate dehydrogenase/methenyltetrahydrofolate cyclohydrolase FolD [Halomonas sp. MCCC 1A17488]MCG3241061.1 bifunctional methylenetetrahydrofolate dehydrogenase/methenyltetrahydrofolate cyclohydrolase FolD [Halomonas sp. MCCC 1A17488]QPP48922.1 bifunctional methylenetetrahydrofolate dehydrogenase/methenyltetrahydrof
MTHLIDGKALSNQVLVEVASEVERIKAVHGIVPTLAVVLVGEDPASQVYVRNKVKRAEEVGMGSVSHRLDAKSTQQDLNNLIDSLNTDSLIHGILVQLPLPEHLNEDEVIARINPAKDVDGFHPLNVGALAAGRASLVPCTPQGCMIMLRQIHSDLSGKRAVVIGRSNIVGKPMAALLLQENCTVTIAHSRTQDIEAVCRNADIVVAAAGRAKLINSDWIRPGATVIDVGINAIEIDGKRKLMGDVDFDSVAPISDAISPVPGGVGPMTIACLLLNTTRAAARQLS